MHIWWMSSFIPNQRRTTFKIFGCAVMLLGKQKQKKQKTNVCVFWALSLQTSDVSNGINKTGIHPSNRSRKSGSNSELGEEVEQMDKLVDRQEEVVSE